MRPLGWPVLAPLRRCKATGTRSCSAMRLIRAANSSICTITAIVSQSWQPSHQQQARNDRYTAI